MNTIRTPFKISYMPQQPGRTHSSSRMVASIFQADPGNQDGCKQSSQHDDLALGHEVTNRRTAAEYMAIRRLHVAQSVTPRKARGLIQESMPAKGSLSHEFDLSHSWDFFWIRSDKCQTVY